MSKTVVSLLFSNYKNDNRVYKTAKSLSENGYDVTVVGLFHGDVLEQEQQEKIKVKRLKLSSSVLPSGNKFFGSIKYLEFFYRLIKGFRKADIWHCNDWKPFFVGILARAFNRKLQLVYDCHELQSETLGISKLEKYIVKFLEKNYAVKVPIITVGEGIKKIYMSRYGIDESKITLIHNAPHLSAQSVQSTVLKDKFKIPTDQTLLIYQGALSSGRGVPMILETFRELEHVHVVFMGYGIFEEEIQKNAETHANIHFHEAVSYDKLIEYSASADFGIISVENVCLNYYHCMPNKLFEYIQAEIPIFVNALEDCRNFVEKQNIGIAAEEESVQSWKTAILELSKMKKADFTENLRIAKAQFNWENEEKKLLELYNSLD